MVTQIPQRSYILLILCFFTRIALNAHDNPVLRDASASMWKIADGVYCIVHDDATDEWPHGNTGVIIGEKHVLVVDATYSPSRAAADIALIRKITERPVDYLVYTHWHFDHNNGGVSYKKANPSIQIVSERNTKRYIELNTRYWSKMSTAT